MLYVCTANKKEAAMYIPRSVARTFLERSARLDIKLTNLKLQKLMYLANGLMLAKHGRPLVSEAFQAWKYGPVVESLYHDLKVYGQGAIRPDDAYLRDWPKITGAAPDELDAIDGVLNQFGSESAGQLIQLTHDPKGPWHDAYQADVSQITIDSKKIGAYFKAKLR